MALIKADIIMARQGIELYKSNEIKEVKNQAAYHLQQAAEKMIKIQIYRSGVPYDPQPLLPQCLKKFYEHIPSSSRLSGVTSLDSCAA